MKLRRTKDTDKHENVTQVCTKYLNHPSGCRVGNQRIRIRVSVEEPIVELKRTDNQHRGRLYQHETGRQQQHIDRPITFHVSLGLLASFLTCPPSELYDISH